MGYNVSATSTKQLFFQSVIEFREFNNIATFAIACEACFAERIFMDELYRAKRIDNRAWVYWTTHGKLTFTQYGKLVSGNVGLTDWVWELLTDDATQSRSIGKKDRNGTEIFGGDIVRHYNNPSAPGEYELGIIEWDAENFRWTNYCPRENHRYTIGANCNYEIIGNVVDCRITEDFRVVERAADSE